MAFTNETYTLPSNGKLGDKLPTEVTIRNMTTAEEKLLLGSTGDALDAIIKKCIVTPENLDLGELISADKHFLLFKLRIISYGNDYFVSFKCPDCGKISEYKINLDEMETLYLKDDFKEPYDEFELPVCKKTISLKLPRVKEIDQIATRVKKYMKKFPEAQGNIGYIYGIMSAICEVDEETLTSTELQKFVEELCVKDSSYLKNRISKLEVGLDTKVYEECPKCGGDIEFVLPINSEFFRTRFDD